MNNHSEFFIRLAHLLGDYGAEITGEGVQINIDGRVFPVSESALGFEVAEKIAAEIETQERESTISAAADLEEWQGESHGS